jgi:putative ABC transport system permease protein
LPVSKYWLTPKQKHMLAKHLITAYRSITRRKGFAILNIAGLSIGICCCLLIFHYVSFEKSYDTFQPDGKQIFRLRLDSYQQGQLAWKSATSYPAFGPVMKKDFPEVEKFCRLHDADILLSNDRLNLKFKENKGYYADPAFLSMFDIKLIKGNPATALNAPYKIILTESTAKKYFPNEDAVGKTLTIRDPAYTRDMEVTGIMKEVPGNSHLIINHVASYSTLSSIVRDVDRDTSNATETSFGWYDFYTYLQLKPGTDVKKFESKFPVFADKYMNDLDWAKSNNMKNVISLIPLSDIHLYSNYNQEAEANGNGQAVSFLFLIALLIIGIAWFNYINLSTARSVERAKEVGVRKVLGAERSELVRQFLTESFLLNIGAMLIALLFFLLLVRPFDNLIGKSNADFYTMDATYWSGFLLIFLAGTFLSGLCPAFVLSGYKPVSVLKGVFKNTAGGLTLRKTLIVLQFITSVVLIAGTIVVYKQVDFMQQQKLGANINQTLVIEGAQSPADSLYDAVFQPFKTELQKIPAVKNVTASTSVMGKEIYWTNGLRRLDKANAQASTLYHLGIDYDFIPTYEMRLLSGRNFSKEFPTDTKAAILTESGMKVMGFANAAEAIDKKLRRGKDTLTIIGIAASYHHQGLQKSIDPMILLLRPDTRNFYSVKLEGSNQQQTIAQLQSRWNKYFPADPFNYFFLDDLFNQQYKSDILFGKLFGVFALLGIIIACFGLLGLSAYNVLQRTKEIGIRKVLGASEQNIVGLLSKDFMKLVGIALIIAIPVTWFSMNRWLQDFAYRTNIAWWVFTVAGVIALLIAFITISAQSIKAAISNPVKSLRTE